MELKDIVLSALSDMQHSDERKDEENTKKTVPVEKTQIKTENKPKTPVVKQIKQTKKSDEELFLKNLKERILVMFEGYNSPQNENLEAKLDITVNFLEYLLSVTDERLEAINSSKK